VNIIPYNYLITATACTIVICYIRRVGGIRGTDNFKFL